MSVRQAARHRTVVLCALGTFTILAAADAAAQPRWGRPQVPRSGACFYRHVNFQGEYFCVNAGENLPAIPRGLNDEISSIRTFGGAEVTIFRDDRFGGRSERFDRNVRNLKDEGWNDRLSSARIRGGRGNDSYGGRQDADRIVRRAYQDILNREPDQAGLRLYRSRIIDDGWTEAQVREALRKSPEYREQNTMTRPKAEEIVRRAYLAVLNREPDPGSRTYVDKVLRDKWTQQDVERELRKSPEYRRR